MHAKSPSCNLSPTSAATASLMAARLRLPHLDSRVVLSRPRIHQRDDAFGLPRVTLMVAPAGYGKTTAMMALTLATGRDAIWLTLEPRDNHLLRLAEHLGAAVVGTGSTLPAMPDCPTTESLAAWILEALAQRQQPTLVVLDDFHHLTTPEVVVLLRLVVELAPPQICFLVGSRTEPPWPVARWRMRGHLTDLRTDDLRFTLAETNDLCAQWLGAPLAPHDVEFLFTATEGWAAALRLILMRLRQEPAEGRSAALQQLTASNRHLTGFFNDEILHAFPPDLRTVMMRLALLDPITEDLCRYVLGSDHVPGTLDHLWQQGTPISPLDEEGTWFRFHPLFGRFLRQRLAQTHSPAEIATLHSQASQWWEANHQPAQAIDHAILASDWTHATNLIPPLIPTLEATHQLERLSTWFAAVPTEIIRDSPDLSAWYAWTLVRTGDLDTFEQYLTNTGDQPDALLPGVDESIRAVAAFYRGNGHACMAHALAALDMLPADAATERLRAEAALGLGESHTGRSRISRSRLEAFHAQAPVSAMLLDTEVQLCWVMMMTGDTTAACHRLTRFIERHSGKHSDAIRRAYVMLADISIEAADYATAREFLRVADERAARFGAFPLLADSRLRWARLHHRCGEPDLAITSLVSMAGDATVTDNRRVQTQIGAFLAELWMAQDRTTDVDRWIRAGQFEVTSSLEFIDEAEYPVFAQWLLRHGRLQDAQTVAIGLCRSAQRDGRLWHLGQHLALLAMVQERLGDRSLALATTLSMLNVVVRSQTVTSLAMHGQLLLALMQEAAANDAQQDLVRRVRNAIEPPVAPPAGSPSSPAEPLPLSERELEVLRLIEIGYSNRAISEHLFIAIPTVKRHVTNIFHKLEASNRTDAIYKARIQSLI